MSMRMIGGLKNRSKFLPNIPYLFLRFNELSGSTVSDSSGNSRDQTLTGSSANFWISGRNGRNCGYFDTSIPNYISLPIAYFDGTNGSWFCWINADWTNKTVGSEDRLFCTYSTGGGNYSHRTFWNGTNFYWYVGNEIGSNGSNMGDLRPYDNIWCHIGWAWSYPGSGNTTVTPYLNGQKVTGGILNVTGSLANPDISFDIGRWFAPNYFTGQMQDFFFAQECLSDYEVELLYKY